MVNYLRQLDRLIEYKEKMNIPDKDITFNERTRPSYY